MVKVVVVGMVLVTKVVAVKVEEVVGMVLVTDVVVVKMEEVGGNTVLVKVALTRTWCRWWW